MNTFWKFIRPFGTHYSFHKESRGGVGWKFKREGTCVYLWLIHVDVWQKSTQYCKAIILQLRTELKEFGLCCATQEISTRITGGSYRRAKVNIK